MKLSSISRAPARILYAYQLSSTAVSAEVVPPARIIDSADTAWSQICVLLSRSCGRGLDGSLRSTTTKKNHAVALVIGLSASLFHRRARTARCACLSLSEIASIPLRTLSFRRPGCTSPRGCSGRSQPKISIPLQPNHALALPLHQTHTHTAHEVRSCQPCKHNLAVSSVSPSLRRARVMRML